MGMILLLVGFKQITALQPSYVNFQIDQITSSHFYAINYYHLIQTFVAIYDHSYYFNLSRRYLYFLGLLLSYSCFNRLYTYPMMN